MYQLFPRNHGVANKVTRRKIFASQICLLIFTVATFGAVASSQENQKSEPLIQKRSIASAVPAGNKSFPGDSEKKAGLSPAAKQLAEQLGIAGTMAELKAKKEELKRNDDTKILCQIIALRQKLFGALQYASIEVEEAVAAIDQDLAQANMIVAYISTKQNRTTALNNIATFVGSGTFGVLDSSTSIKIGTPAPNILGIVGNSIAVALPTWGLRKHEYIPPRKNATSATNMLAPIFNRPFEGESYDPIVWNFIDSVPPDSKSTLTRRQQLLQQWKQYRDVDLSGGATTPAKIDAIVGIQKKGAKITLDLVKTRAELLVDLRALVQLMYRDISDLNTAIMQIDD